MVKYIEYTNPLGKECGTSKRETDDCTVKAISAVLKCTYEEAHEFCRKYLNREERSPVPYQTIVNNFKKLKKQGFIVGDRLFHPTVLPLSEIQNAKFVRGIRTNTPKTIDNFARTHPKGNYIVVTYKHALSLVNGVFIENKELHEKGRRLVKAVIKINKK